jgi:hypothetical protein
MFENVIPKTPQQKGPFDQRRTIKKSPDGRARWPGRTARAHVTSAERSEQWRIEEERSRYGCHDSTSGPVAAPTAIPRCRLKIENNAQSLGPILQLQDCADK